MTTNQQHNVVLRIVTFCLLIISLSGCASAPINKNVLAIVDGEPITHRDLEYALQIEHRREDLSSASALDISGYVQRLVNDKLIVQEARRMGMDEDPGVQMKVKAYVLRESVTRLYKEEIVEKAVVTEEEIVNKFKEDNERFVLDILEFTSETNAEEVMEKLQRGESFEKFTDQYPASFHKKGGEKFIFIRKSLGRSIKEVVVNLQPGEISDVIQIGNKYYIIKLINTEEAPYEEIENLRAGLESSIRQQKIKERSKEYVKQLREKASIKIDRELLSSITLDNAEARKQWLGDKRPLVVVNDTILTAGQFAATIPLGGDEKAKENAINRWLDNKVVDHEALSRQYDKNTDLKEMVQRYQGQILGKVFTNKVIFPKIKITEEEVKEYYLNNKERYLKPAMYKIQQITTKTIEDAQDILKNLQGGASFSWLAKTKSTDSVAQMGGVKGWRRKDQLSKPVSDIIDTLNPGDISPILKIDPVFRIIRLQEKAEGEVEEFSSVKDSVHRLVFRKKFRALYDSYIDTLKKEAKIEINEAEVQAFERRFKNN